MSYLVGVYRIDQFLRATTSLDLKNKYGSFRAGTKPTESIIFKALRADELRRTVLNGVYVHSDTFGTIDTPISLIMIRHPCRILTERN